MDATIPTPIQDAVDLYLELYQLAKQLEERMKQLREQIEPFMKENGVYAIGDRQRTGKVQLSASERPTPSARFTTYDLEDVLPLLEPAVVDKCVMRVVDKDKLEALAKLGEVPVEILALRRVKLSYSFQARIGTA